MVRTKRRFWKKEVLNSLESQETSSQKMTRTKTNPKGSAKHVFFKKNKNEGKTNRVREIEITFGWSNKGWEHREGSRKQISLGITGGATKFAGRCEFRESVRGRQFWLQCAWTSWAGWCTHEQVHCVTLDVLSNILWSGPWERAVLITSS